MDLSTKYLGFDLPHPFMPGASPMVDDMDLVRRLEDAGAAAIVMHSLFEEQLKAEELARVHAMEVHTESFAEALTYLPDPAEFTLGPDEYLNQLRRIREAVKVPVFASLNGTTAGGWIEYAKLMEQAGASALELNVYEVATDPDERGADVEHRVADVVRLVRAKTTIPLAVKLSPFYTSMPSFARDLVGSGAGALVVFNRFYQPDIDVENLETLRSLRLSESFELLPRLHALALLYDQVGADLAVTGGVHWGIDALKATMAGASAIQLVSALLRFGPEHLVTVRREVIDWLERHEYESLGQARGSMSLKRCPDPHTLERTNYARVLQSWRV